VKWEDEIPTPKVGDLESSGTPECSEFDSRGQNTSHWGVPGVVEKILKRRYRKWPRIGHLDICSPSYGQKKGRESNWQFDSRPLKVGNRPLPDLRIESARFPWKRSRRGLQLCFRPRCDQTPQSGVMSSQSPETPTGTISRLQLGSLGKKSHLDVASAERCREYYMGEGGGFPRVRALVSLVV
jgi:hypothetical protein